MTKTLQKYRINGLPQGFKPFIESWFKVIHDYEEKTRYDDAHGDAIYWYNERANVGAFASGLSRLKTPVIEEYTCMKRRGSDKKPGRADLSFYYRGDWYLTEAKLQWERLTPQAKPLCFPTALEDSLEDTKNTWQEDKGTIPLGLTFIVPFIHPNDKAHIPDLVKRCINQLETENPCDFWAYCAPGRLRNLQSSIETKSYYPMVIMLGKKCDLKT